MQSLKIPIVYTLTSCPACKKLKEDWTKEGLPFEERVVSESQAVLDEALNFGDMVPIVVFPDGKVEVGYKDMIG
jgi:glutaredoxin